ncbi:hypothetical protein ER308_06250 [Egibacter rhizosphaerae]|uniref:Anti-sigma factor n=1 Tax=Egibacter rhizosphaerae TaxID=1670831 RepID=A0A411YDE9_9ACTN|nr:hypothetical protein [Egibacter rhizosphaerae]QBI19177.1 hypothetical protein ER308_06250 [Egibacter rhizosphaerae]
MEAPTVTVRIPPDAEHVPLFRTTVAGIAARADCTLDEVEDLRMGVEEAAVLLLRQGGGDRIDLDVVIGEEALEVSVARAAMATDPIEEGTFSWQILSALSDELRLEHSEGTGRIVLVKHRNQARDPAPAVSPQAGAAGNSEAS